MDFIQFARQHGVIINDYPPIGVWKRYPTEDHPRKRNGAVKYLGTHGLVQNHAIDTEVSVWQPGSDHVIDRPMVAKAVKDAQEDILRMQRDAMRKAVGMLNSSGLMRHKYLQDKGFDQEQGNVWMRDGVPYLLIPMRVKNSLVGVQVIEEDGTKKFLYGQRTGGASFTIDNNGTHFLVEGYATGLAVRAALKALKKRYTLHICFSAGNMLKIAATLPDGIVIADNDESGTGERVAKQIGWPYWMSDSVGEDFNDFWRRVGLFKSTQSLSKLMLSIG